MRLSTLILSLFLFVSFEVNAQIIAPIATQSEEPLPFVEIPDAPESAACGNILSRFIDALGYRYYWATEGLRKEDLKYKPGEDSRTIGETLEHLHGLSNAISNAFQKKANIRGGERKPLSFEEQRKQTLVNLKTASDILKANPEADLLEYPIIFQRGEQTSEFPIWNLINGQITDAIYHVGQIVAFRRASGNPIDSKVNVFTGKNRK